MEIRTLKDNETEDFSYPLYQDKENTLLSINDEKLGNVNLSIRSNQITYQKNVLFINGTNPIELNVVYCSDSLNQDSTIQLKGLKFNYEQRIIGENNGITYYDEFNKKHFFKLIDGTSQYFNNGLILTIQNEFLIDSNGKYTITDLNDNVYVFNKDGYLIKIEKKVYNNTIKTDITYENGLIKTIKSDNNPDITFTYSATNISRTITIECGIIKKEITIFGRSITVKEEDVSVLIGLNEDGKITEITETKMTLVNLFETIKFTIKNNCFTEIKKILVKKNTLTTTNEILYEYKISKYDTLYQIDYIEKEAIQTTNYYMFNEDGSLSISYEKNEGPDFGITDIKEYVQRKGQIQYLNPYNYFHKYYFPNKSIHGEGTLELSLNEAEFPPTEVYSLIYNFNYTVKNQKALVTIGICLDGNVLSETLISLVQGEKQNFSGIISFKIPVNDELQRKDLSQLTLKIVSHNNQDGLILLQEIYIYGHQNTYQGVLIDKQDASVFKYKIKDSQTTSFYGYLFNGRIKLNDEIIYLTDREIVVNYKSCLKAISQNETKFYFFYNNFSCCKKLSVDFTCIFINENGKETSSATFKSLRLLSFQKNGDVITLKERNTSNYQNYKIIKNQRIDGVNEISIGTIVTKNDQYVINSVDETIKVIKSYDNNGNLLNNSYSSNEDTRSRIENKYEYINNQLSKEINYSKKGNREKSFTYDELNNVKTVCDEENHLKSFKLDEKGRIIEITEKLQELELTNKITYNSDNSFDNITSVSKNIYAFSYDSFGNIIDVKINTNTIISQSVAYPSTNDRKIITVTYPNNQQLIFTYDKYNRLVEMSNKDKTIAIYIYADYIKGKAIENVGDPFDTCLVVNRSSLLRKIITNEERQYSYVYRYDSLNRLSRIEKIGMYNIYYHYDKIGNLISRERTFNKDDTSKMVMSIKYLKQQALTSQMLDTYSLKYIYFDNEKVFNEQYFYDSFNRVKQINSYKTKYQISYESFDVRIPRGVRNNYLINQFTSYIDDIVYQTETISYDLKGNISEINGLKNVKYTYDEVNRLIKEEDATSNISIDYAFDNQGRLISINKKQNGETINQKTFEYKSTINYDLITKVNDNEVNYDENCNLSKYLGNTYYYENGHQLTKIINEEKDVMFEYAYNEKGIRREKRKYKLSTSELLQVIEYIVDGNKILQEKTYNYEENQESYALIYLYGSRGVEGFIYKNEEYFYIKNILGDIIAIIDNQGNTKVKYEYDSYGNFQEIVIDNTFTNLSSFIYRGYYYDKETGLFYCNSRYYSPELCCWISPDSVDYLNPNIINGCNLYVCMNNNPMNIVCNKPIISDMTSDNGSSPNISNSWVDGSIAKLPKINSVAMTHYTDYLIKNPAISWIIGNVSYTATTQLNSSENFFSFSDIGNDGYSVGVGANLGNWYGISIYATSDFGYGLSWQFTPWIKMGTSWSFQNGFSVSGGIIIGDTSHEFTISIGNGIVIGYALCAGIALSPFVGARAVAAVLACIILFVDIFNKNGGVYE